MINQRYINIEDHSEIKTKLDLIYKSIFISIKNDEYRIYSSTDIELDYNESIIVNKLLLTIKKQTHIQTD